MVIGITGGIASGKSLVTSFLAAMGHQPPFIIDADEVYRNLTGPGGALSSAIAAVWGTTVLKDDGSVDRKKLGALVFSKEEELKKLNSVTHPVIIDEIRRQIDDRRGDIVVLAAPLLIEAGQIALVDELWLVMVDEKKQVERLMGREHITEEDAMARIRSQMPLCEKIPFARRIIDNNGTRRETEHQIESLWNEVTGHGKDGTD